MLIRKAFKFLLRPTGEQERKMHQFAGSCRFVYNKALSLQNKEEIIKTKKHVRYESMWRWLKDWKSTPELAWLNDATAQILQQSLMDLDKAFKNYENKSLPAAYPKFKKKGKRDAFRYPQNVKLEQNNQRIYLPKIGWVRLRLSRDVIGKIKNATVSLKAGKWYVSIQTEFEVDDPVHPATSQVGIDVGVKRLATLSDGTYTKPINSFKRNRRKLAKLQRRLAKQIKGSNNWKKQKLKIQRLHCKITNTRHDHLHKLTTAICKNHAVVVIERLRIKNMTKSAKGTVDKPGRNVKAKSGLNRVILDQGWGTLFTQLVYKQTWLGGKVQMVSAIHTSQECSVCRYVSKENRKSQANFVCEMCGCKANADANAALNILARGVSGVRLYNY